MAAILRICVLASSSAGNSIFVASRDTRILIDAGLNRKETLARLASIGEEAARLDAILITHEHSDHVAGLPVLMKTVHAPVFATPLTASAIDWNGTAADVRTFDAGASFQVGDLRIQSFTVPHDARDPVAYTVSAGSAKVAVATDLGYLPDNVKFHLRGSQFLLLESNHCPELLRVGPYPWHLKQRILSRKGHLSNEAAAEYIGSEEMSDEVEIIVLGHLSETNNNVWQAEIVADQALQRRRTRPRRVVAVPRKQSELFQL